MVQRKFRDLKAAHAARDRKRELAGETEAALQSLEAAKAAVVPAREHGLSLKKDQLFE